MDNRTVLDFDVEGNALEKADSWARTFGFAIRGNEADGTRTYGRDTSDGGPGSVDVEMGQQSSILVSIRQRGARAHLEAWLTFGRGSTFVTPREETILGGGYPQVQERWQARKLVNPLLADLGQPPIPDPPVVIAVDLVPAGPGRRFLALVVDTLIGLSLLAALGAATRATGYSPQTGGWTTTTSLVEAVGLAIIGFYVPFLWLFAGGTLGQRLLGMRLVDGRTGARLDVGTVLVRYVLWLALLVPLFPAFVAAVLTIEDPYQRSWLDKKVGTILVKRP
jgi:hypothetical protein